MLPMKMLKLTMCFCVLLAISDAILFKGNGCSHVKSWELCCGGKVVRKKGHDTKCCGTQAYNSLFFMCCEGQINKKLGVNPQCCGTISYSNPIAICCCGTLYRRIGLFSKCCGNMVYKADKHMCCNNELRVRSKCSIYG